MQQTKEMQQIKKYVDANSWSINGDETTSARVTGTLNNQDLAIIRNNQTMLTFTGDEIVTSKPLGFINDSGLASILIDSDGTNVPTPNRCKKCCNERIC
jgi:hypothetical protein